MVCMISSAFVFWVVPYCRELLSKQQHYDWGLRALKTVLRGSGVRLQEEKRSKTRNEEIELGDTQMSLRSFAD